MLAYIIKRIIYMIPVTVVLSFICFLIVDLAPGDFVTVYMTRLQSLQIRDDAGGDRGADGVSGQDERDLWPGQADAGAVLGFGWKGSSRGGTLVTRS